MEANRATDEANRIDVAVPHAHLRSLARAVDAKDAGTGEHSLRVGRLAELMALHDGWHAEDARRLANAGVVHDIGKLGIDEAILQAPRRLTTVEFAQIMLHPRAGAQMLAADSAWDDEQVEWVLHHHERPDGQGYPDALGRSAITPGSSILHVADCFDVMVSDRPYKLGKTIAEAMGELCAECGHQFCHPAVTTLEALYTSGVLRQAYAGAA